MKFDGLIEFDEFYNAETGNTLQVQIYEPSIFCSKPLRIELTINSDGTVFKKREMLANEILISWDESTSLLERFREKLEYQLWSMNIDVSISLTPVPRCHSLCVLEFAPFPISVMPIIIEETEKLSQNLNPRPNHLKTAFGVEPIRPKMKAELTRHLIEKYSTQFNDEPVSKCQINDSLRTDDKILETFVDYDTRETDPGKLPQSIPLHTNARKNNMIELVARASARLLNCDELGIAVINEINCLMSGSYSQWPIWTGSTRKLLGIVEIINALPEESIANLSVVLLDKESALYNSIFTSLSSLNSVEIEPDAATLNDIQRFLDIFEFLKTEGLTK